MKHLIVALQLASFLVFLSSAHGAPDAATGTSSAQLLKLYTVEDLKRELAARSAPHSAIATTISNHSGNEMTTATLMRPLAMDEAPVTDEPATDAPAQGKAKMNFRILESGSTNQALKSITSQQIVDSIYLREKSIYGVSAADDRRREVYTVTDTVALQQARSVPALCTVDHIVDNGDGTSTLQGPTLHQALNLCPNVEFSGQKMGAYASAFLVAPDLIVTASHCVTGPTCPPLDHIRVVFGFAVDPHNPDPNKVSNSDIYQVTSIVGEDLTEGKDWAILRLNRPVTNRTPLAIQPATQLPNDASLYVLGYPCGLPEKFADEGLVRLNTDPAFFVSNLDTFGGNSGSPVFNATTHQVEGMLIEGAPDFFLSGTDYCQLPSIYPTTGSAGEICTRVSQFAPHLPAP
jgi:V8-like Glu-specific endopeptidase